MSEPPFSRPHLSRVAAWRLAGVMLLFGFSSGLPLFLTNFTLQQWLSETHVSLRAIGATALIGLPYTLKFLWAPLVDRVRLGPLARFGRRRSWLLVLQPLLAGALLLLGASDPPHALEALAAAAVLVAFFSASQDILIDAWRIENFSPGRQGEALALYVWGYRIAILVSQGGAIFLAGRIGWHGAYAVMAALMGVGFAATLLAPEQPGAPAPRRSLGATFAAPLAEFLRRPRAWQIIAFVLLFQLGTSFADTMAAPFYRSLGFDRAAIVVASSLPMLIGGALGVGAGGLLVVRVGAARATLLAGLVQMASLGLYLVLIAAGPDRAMLVGKVAFEAFAEGLASASFLAFLSGLCAREFTATQYALLSSLAPLAWRTLAGTSGLIAGAVGWPFYFALTMLGCLPALAILAVLPKTAWGSAPNPSGGGAPRLA